MRTAVVTGVILLVIIVGALIWYEGAVTSEDFEELKEVFVPTPVVLPEPTADAWGVFDLGTGELTTGENTTELLPIASITKLFVAIAVMESDKKTMQAPIEWVDLGDDGERATLTHGMITTPETLLFPLLLESSNDSGKAIDRMLGEEDEATIGRILRDWNLTRTVIADSTGLSPHNVSTVEDLAQFYSRLREEYTYVNDITRLQRRLADGYGMVNNNPAREFDSFIGGKHGYTDEAGRTFVGSFILEDRRRIGVVLLGSEDIMKDLEDIIAYATEVD